MKNRSVYLLLALFSFILFSIISCEKEKEEPQLPPITQTGAGTFGCVIDGEVWNADPLLFGSPLGASNNQWDDKRWVIDAVGNGYTIILEICKDSVINGASTFIGSSENSCSSVTLHKKNSQTETSTFLTSGTNVGKIIVTRYDTIERITSGTFYFDAVNSLGEKIEVRDGRFDVKFINYEP